MRFEKRYTAKAWARPWMFWLVIYPFCFFRNIYWLHSHTKEDVGDILFEWKFKPTPKERSDDV